MTLQHRARVVMSFLMVAALFGCSAPPPVTQTGGLKVTDIDVGRSVGADMAIGDKTDSFGSADTFYVSIRTEGSSPSATLTARWTYEDGQVVDESSQTITPSGGAAVTEFHLSKPDGWPTGGYTVEVLLDNVSAGTKDFRVT